MHLGIDYGAKMAGTTEICYLNADKLNCTCTKKNENADTFIQQKIKELRPVQIFIDAPLSLPLAYSNKGIDFHYRECDRLLSAMSPMFLGGLTARAMTIKNLYPEIEFYEAYPKMVSKTQNLHEWYKNDITNYITELQKTIEFSLPTNLKNWHEIDAILAWIAGSRYNSNTAKMVGNPEEGIIIY